MRARLFALIAIPTLVAAALAGYRVSVSLDNAESFQRLERLATLGERMAVLAHELENERDTRVQFAAGGTRTGLDLAEMSARQRAVDDAAAKVRAAAAQVETGDSTSLRLTVGNVVTRIEVLPALRRLAGQLPPSVIVDKYTSFITDVNNFHVQVAQNAPRTDLAQNALALSALSRAKDAASRERALVATALWAGRFEQGDLTALEKARTEWESALASFRSASTAEQRQRYDDTVTGPEIDRAEYTRVTALYRARASRTLAVRPLGWRNAAEWTRDMSFKVDRTRTVEAGLARTLTERTTALEDDASTAALRDAALALITLILVLLTTVLVARSLVRPLRRLQAGALEVAGSRLPGLVDRLRDPEAAAGGIEVEPIDVDSSDEIGQVARAFDEVHREAVRLAADEAVLRGNINAMFVNLSRRSQSLIERQLRLIEELEQSERDEEQLANLFRLDHLATRMRRNCENLLVLGGQEQVRRRNQPVPLIDVVRASLSEVEQYERVALRVQGDMRVAGPAVNDLVHLLAELVENATTFSSENTKVTVSGQLLSGGGAMLQINDNGVGMSPEELEQANWRLANPPVIDFSAARRMGLFVVGRLAVRHGVRVELRAAQGGGLTAFVVLPDALVAPGDPGVGSRAFGAPAAPAALPAGPAGAGGNGLFQRDEPVPGQRRSRGDTGGFPAVRDSGPQPVYGGAAANPMFDGARDQRPREDTGAHALYSDTGYGDTGYSDNGYADNGYSDNGYAGTGEHRMAENTGAHPLFGDTGEHRAAEGTGAHGVFDDGRDQRSREDTGAHPLFGGTGDHRTGDTGTQRALGDTGPVPAVPSFGDTGPQPVVPPAAPPADRPASRLGELPVRQPGTNLPGRAGAAPGGAQNGARPPLNGAPASPRDQRRDLPPENARPAVPEAQPEVPAQQRRPISWETGPQPAVPESGPAGPDRWEEPPASGGGASAPEPFTLEEPISEPPAAPPGPRPQIPRRRPERSPIFDAMQSEWFQRRDVDEPTDDLARGWSSPADAGFQAAEAAAKPVAGQRTSVGLPKRVPGKNRVPGAVAGNTTPPTVPTGTPGGTAGGAPPQPRGQSADTVRNRFASLQRGVHKGRLARDAGPGDTTGEGPSYDDGETGGTR
ncbi:nitrate- and nitrite sensing domain-containing protein [Actinomadura hibisca]|uniref:nitrate- and nitrite sensing domain-containing protein n=1 Tax=Actinomadura hibisca TaxID=68565 RepID=UPI000833CBFF|nr:nitrate- and nitrite sensing domain-containing protein [Actinomadura hibisca]